MVKVLPGGQGHEFKSVILNDMKLKLRMFVFSKFYLVLLRFTVIIFVFELHDLPNSSIYLVQNQFNFNVSNFEFK